MRFETGVRDQLLHIALKCRHSQISGRYIDRQTQKPKAFWPTGSERQRLLVDLRRKRFHHPCPLSNGEQG